MKMFSKDLRRIERLIFSYISKKPFITLNSNFIFNM